MDYFVGSEIGKLRKVIVHRPDLELRRLTPKNHDELLYIGERRCIIKMDSGLHRNDGMHITFFLFVT